jgi:hypothetical protein
MMNFVYFKKRIFLFVKLQKFEEKKTLFMYGNYK